MKSQFSLNILGLLLATTLSAANIPLQVVSVTSQQAEIQYASTISGPCTLSMTDNSGLGVTVWDVNGSKFANANQDLSRPDTLVNGQTRKVLLGHRVYQQGSDGKIYSMSLQADAPHTLALTCGSDTGTVSFSTLTIPQGQNYPELPQYCSGAGAMYGSHCWPTIDYTVAGKEIGYVDAFTGALVKRVTGPGENGARLVSSYAFSYVKDQSGTSAWTNPANAATYSATGPYATSSTIGAKLFIGWGQLIDTNIGGSPIGGFQLGLADSVDDMLARLRTFSSVNGDTVATCFSFGQTCDNGGATLTCTVTTSSADVLFGSVGATNCAGGTWPGAIASGLSNWTGPFEGWSLSAPPRRDLFSSPQLAVSVNGTAVTLTANYPNGNAFNVEWPAGQPIQISGSSSACPNNVCTIASVTSTTALTINENPGNIGAQTAHPTAGILVWKSAGTGTISVNANFDWAHSSPIAPQGPGGYITSSSSVPTTKSVTCAGAAITGTAHSGALAYFSPGSIWFFDETSGSGCYISDNFFYLPSFYQFGIVGNKGLTYNPFSATAPNIWYTYLPNIQPTSPTTSTSGTFAAGTSGTVSSCGDFTTTPEGVFIPGAGLSGADYFGNLVSCTGTTITLTPATQTSVTTGTKLYHNESVLYASTYSGDYRAQLLKWPSGASPNPVYTNISQAPSSSTYPNDIGTKFYTLANSGCASCLTYLKAFNAGLASATPSFAGTLPNGFANMFVWPGGQNNAYWAFPYDIANNVFKGALDTFSTPTGRNAFVHTTFPEGPSGYTFVGPQQTRQANGVLSGLWYSTVTAVWRSANGVTGTWDTANTCIPDLLDTKSCATDTPTPTSPVNYAYPCPAGTSDYWTTTSTDANNQLLQMHGGSGGPYTSSFFGGNNCIQIRVNGDPCSTNSSSAERTAYPCASNPGNASNLQAIAVGDEWTDRYSFDNNDNSCQDCEHGVIVQINGATRTSTLVEMFVYRTAAGGGTVSNGLATIPYPGKSALTPNSPINTYGNGKIAHKNGWSYSVETAAFGGAWWYDSANPGNGWTHGTYLFDGGHTAPAANLVGGLGVCALSTPLSFSGYNCQTWKTLPGDFTGTHNIVGTGYFPYFNGSQVTSPMVGSVYETYPSATASNGTADKQRWLTDYHDPVAGDGIGFENPQQIFNGITATLAGGFSHVYALSSVAGGTIDEKNAPLFSNSGRFLNQNISGPASLWPATQITDAKTGTFCYARVANECFTGSTAGVVYVNPKSPDVALTCYANQLMVSSICAMPTPAIWGQANLNNVVDLNPEGSGHIRLTGLPNSPMTTPHYSNLRYTASGLWGFYSGTWPAGYRVTDVFAVRIPKIATDTVNRTGFVQVPVRLAAGNSVVIRFGYDSSFRCSGVTDSQGTFVSGYNDSCLTVASATQSQPYMWSSEGAVRAVSCTNGCVVNVPGISGRYMYYRVERYLSGLLTFQGPTQRIPVP
jgi:hypothetical protein